MRGDAEARGAQRRRELLRVQVAAAVAVHLDERAPQRLFLALHVASTALGYGRNRACSRFACDSVMPDGQSSGRGTPALFAQTARCSAATFRADYLGYNEHRITSIADIESTYSGTVT